MKSKLKRVSRSTLSIILVIMMLVSTSLVGMFTTTAATIPDDTSVGATNYFVGGNTIYFKPNTNWQAHDKYAVDFYVGGSHAWVGLYDTDGDGYFSATIPSGQSWTNAIFLRLKVNTSGALTDDQILAGGTSWIGDNAFWDRTKELSGEYGKDCYTIPEGEWSNSTDSGNWSKFNTTTPTEQNYALVGSAGGLNNWDGGYENGKKFVDNKISLTGVKSGQQFRLMGEDGKQYGWSSTYIIDGDASNVDSVELKQNQYVFQFSSDGDYTITLESKAVPPVISIKKGVSGDFSLWDKNSSSKLGDFVDGSLTVNLDTTEYQLYVKDGAGHCFLHGSSTFVNNTVVLYHYETANMDHTIPYTPVKPGEHTFTWDPYMSGQDQLGDLTITKAPTIAPEEATPKFIYRSDETEVDIVAYVDKERVLNNVATLPGVDNPSKYLKYNTVITSASVANVASILSSASNNPIFYSSAPGKFTVETTVTNTTNNESIVRTVNITVEASESAAYRVYNITKSTYINMTETSAGSGVFLSDSTIAKNDVFVIERNLNGKITYSATAEKNDTFWFKDNFTYVPVHYWTGDTGKNMKNTASSEVTVKYDVSKGTYGFGAVFIVKKSYIYAKDGTIDMYGNDNGTSTWGTTKVETDNTNGDGAGITPLENTGFGTHVKKYEILSSGLVKVSTTLKADRVADYYIHAFVVNGRTYIARAGAKNTYYAYVPVEVGSLPLEITPVYYHKDCKEEGKYIKFYVNTNYLKSEDSWGDTIANYAYYYKEDGTSLDPDGGYPGQPMLYDNELQMYYCLMPNSMHEGGKDYPISGITVNNYFNDTAHNILGGKTFSRQTFDFNNMKYIAELGSDIVRMRIVPRHSEKGNKEFIESGAKFDPDTFVSDGHNPYDEFLNINDEKVNIFREKIDPDAPVGLYIVASASYDLKAQGIGEWATQWTVFDAETGERAYDKSFLPSDLIPRDPDGDGVYDPKDQTVAYNALRQEKYLDKKVAISNASRRYYPEDQVYRYDVRWFYANSKDARATVNVKAQLSEDGTNWTQATEDISRAYFEYEGKKYTNYDDVKVGSTVDITAVAPKGYIFTGFGTVDSDGNNFTPIESGKIISPEISFSMNYVARFEKIQEGQLIISHKKYDLSDAQGGSGLYKVKAELLDGDGNVKEIHEVAGIGANGQTIDDLKVTSEQALNGYKLRITLTTTTSGQNTFRNWYEADEFGLFVIGDSEGDSQMTLTHEGKTEVIEDPTGKSGTLSFTFTNTLDKYFGDDNLLDYSSLRFYSDIYPVTKDYSITYKYTDRFGNQKSYLVTGTHDDTYYDDPDGGNGSWVPNEKMIAEKAPYIDDLYKDCKWIVDDVSVDGTSVTVRADQNGKTYNVAIYDEEDFAETMTLKLNDLVYKDVDKKSFYEVPNSITVKEADGKDVEKTFQYWEVINTDSGSVVAKCYSTKFNLRVSCNCDIKPYYADEATEDVAFISDAQFTREQYTENGKKYDYLHVDFIVSYMEKNGILLNSDDAKNYKSGIMIEYDTDTLLKENVEGGKLTDEEKLTFEGESLTDEQIKKYLDSKDTTGIAATRKLVNFNINNSKYNNKNNLDYYIKFNNNNDMFRRYIYRAYYYVIDDAGNITVSKPVYFYLYDIGNSVYDDTGSTVSIVG